MTAATMWIAVGLDGSAECGLTRTVSADQARNMLRALDRGINRVEDGLESESALPRRSTRAGGGVMCLGSRLVLSPLKNLKSRKAIVAVDCSGASSLLLNHNVNSDDILQLHEARYSLMAKIHGWRIAEQTTGRDHPGRIATGFKPVDLGCSRPRRRR